MSDTAPGIISIPTIDSLILELTRLSESGIAKDAPIRIDPIVNMPGTFIIREVQV